MRLFGDLNSPSARNPPLSNFESVHTSLTSEGSPNLFKAVFDLTRYSPSAIFLKGPRSFCLTDSHARACGSSISDSEFAGVRTPGSLPLDGACANILADPRHKKRKQKSIFQCWMGRVAPWNSENRIRILPLPMPWRFGISMLPHMTPFPLPPSKRGGNGIQPSVEI